MEPSCPRLLLSLRYGGCVTMEPFHGLLVLSLCGLVVIDLAIKRLLSWRYMCIHFLVLLSCLVADVHFFFSMIEMYLLSLDHCYVTFLTCRFPGKDILWMQSLMLQLTSPHRQVLAGTSHIGGWPHLLGRNLVNEFGCLSR